MSNKDECIAAGVNEADVKRLIARLNSAGKLASKIGVTMFGGSGTLSIRARHASQPDGRNLILGMINKGHWDGGDGGCMQEADGFWRGE